MDTVIAHENHQRVRRENGRLYGSGTVDMKGGDVIALGILRALADRPELYAEAAILLVCDEEWRTAPFVHAETFAGWDACLCFEAGETNRRRRGRRRRPPQGRRNAARARAPGAPRTPGSAPDAGRNALLALAKIAQDVAAQHDPSGGSGSPPSPPSCARASPSTSCPATASSTATCAPTTARRSTPSCSASPTRSTASAWRPSCSGSGPGWTRARPTPPFSSARPPHLGRPLHGHARGGASDASHFAPVIDVTIDGLGPRGGAAHNPGEFVLARSLKERAEVALSVVLAVLDG